MEWTKDDDTKASHWDRIVTLTDNEASRLYAGQWPDGQIPNPDSLRFLHQELQNGNLRCINPLHTSQVLPETAIGSTIGGKIVNKENLYVHNPAALSPLPNQIHHSLHHCQIPHQSLIDLAKTNNHFPPTLFEEKRNAQTSNLISAQPKHEFANIFRKEGAYWLVSFEGKTSHIRDSRGMVYIHYLLKKPQCRISAWELSQIGGYTMDGNQAGDPDLILDRDATKALLLRKNQLEKVAEHQRTPEESLELAQLATEFDANTNLKGQPRPFNDAAGNARRSVQKAISRAIDSIRLVNPALSLFLQNKIDTGADCIYKSTTSFHL